MELKCVMPTMTMHCSAVDGSIDAKRSRRQQPTWGLAQNMDSQWMLDLFGIKIRDVETRAWDLAQAVKPDSWFDVFSMLRCLMPCGLTLTSCWSLLWKIKVWQAKWEWRSWASICELQNRTWRHHHNHHKRTAWRSGTFPRRSNKLQMKLWYAQFRVWTGYKDSFRVSTRSRLPQSYNCHIWGNLTTHEASFDDTFSLPCGRWEFCNVQMRCRIWPINSAKRICGDYTWRTWS